MYVKYIVNRLVHLLLYVLKVLKGTMVWRWVLDLLILIQIVAESDQKIAVKELFNLYAVAAATIDQLNQNSNQIKLKIGPQCMTIINNN